METRAIGAPVARPWTRLMAKSDSFRSSLAASWRGEKTVRIIPPANSTAASSSTALHTVLRVLSDEAPAIAWDGELKTQTRPRA